MPRLRYVRLNLFRFEAHHTHSSALCISSSVADMNSVLRGVSNSLAIKWTTHPPRTSRYGGKCWNTLITPGGVGPSLSKKHTSMMRSTPAAMSA
jgi:hypothetical protein